MIPDQDPQVTKREIKLSAEIARLQRRVEALVGALEQHSHSGLCAVMIGDNGPLCAPCRKRVQEAALRGGRGGVCGIGYSSGTRNRPLQYCEQQRGHSGPHRKKRGGEVR